MAELSEAAKPENKRRSSGSALGCFAIFFRCLGGHDWTSAAMEEKTPTDDQLANGIDGFYDYTAMYCRRCGHVSELSKRNQHLA